MGGVAKTYPKRKRVDKTVHELSEDMCCICLEMYKDDLDGEKKIWIQYSEEDCTVNQEIFVQK